MSENYLVSDGWVCNRGSAWERVPDWLRNQCSPATFELCLGGLLRASWVGRRYVAAKIGARERCYDFRGRASREETPRIMCTPLAGPRSLDEMDVNLQNWTKSAGA